MDIPVYMMVMLMAFLFLLLLRIMPLADALAGVLLVKLHQLVVQRRFRPEVADAQRVAFVFEAMPQDMQRTVQLHGVFIAFVEPLDGIAAALLDEPLPVLRLRPLDEIDQRVDVQRFVDGCAISRIRRFRPPAVIQNQP